VRREVGEEIAACATVSPGLPITNPTGRRFPEVAAAVSDIGGSRSHAAIVARRRSDFPRVVAPGPQTSAIKEG